MVAIRSGISYSMERPSLLQDTLSPLLLLPLLLLLLMGSLAEGQRSGGHKQMRHHKQSFIDHIIETAANEFSILVMSLPSVSWEHTVCVMRGRGLGHEGAWSWP